MNKITPHLWFDKEAKEATEFYVSVFPDSKIKNIKTIHDTPSGDCDIVDFELGGKPFMAISAGPYFKFNPSISFTVSCKTREEVDAIWNKLIVGGTALMEVGSYPFSERYGWLIDRYGLSWQIILAGKGIASETITPALMFTGTNAGKAEEAMNFYVSLFPNSKIESVNRHAAGGPHDKEGTIAHALFTLEGRQFSVMDSAYPHGFVFNEAVSFMVICENQEEIDSYWEKLSAVPEAEQCGWLKDKYGLSWQIVPNMDKWLNDPDKEKADKATQAMLKMKKIVIADLEKAAE